MTAALRRIGLFGLVLAAVVAVAGVVPSLASGGTGAPAISSDRPDYAPGDTVYLSGDGWGMGEVVHINVNDGAGATWSRDVDVTADLMGNITDQFVLPDWFVATYTVTASGPSGTAMSTFTDGNVKFDIAPSAARTQFIETLYDASGNCTGTTKSGFPKTLSNSDGDNVGVGNNESVRLDASAATTNSPALSFQAWSSTDSPASPFTVISGTNGLSICVPGFQSGTRNYRATYGNVAPAVGRDNATVTVGEGQTATNTGTWSDANPTETVTLSASVGTITKSGTNAGGTWNWSFGTTDGPAQNQIVEITATDSRGLTSSTTFALTVTNVAPTATFPATGTVDEGSSSTFAFTSPVDPSSADTAAGFHYAFSCAGASLASATYAGSGTAAAVSCSFPDGPSSSTVRARIIDKDGGFTEYTAAVTVSNVAPSVAISGAASVNEGASYSLTLGAVTDPGADTVSSYVVHWGDGSSDSYGANGAKSHTYADGPNDYEVTVDLVDEDGRFLDRANDLSVHVNNVAPTVTVAGPSPVTEGTSHTYSFTVTDPGDDSFTVNEPNFPSCGDGGSYVANTLVTDADGGTFDCSFPDGPTTTTVAIRVTDSDGASDMDSEAIRVVAVDNVAPTATLGNNGPIDEGGSAAISFSNQFDPSPTDMAAGLHYEYHCDGSTFGSAPDYSSASSSDSTSCAFGDDGNYTVRARIIDKNNAATTYTTQVQVDNVAPSVAISGAANVNEGSPYSLTVGAVTDPGQDTVSSYVVHWGDGSSDSYGANGAKSHTYADGPNDYEVTVDLVDEDGSFLDRANDLSVHVNNLAPSVAISGAASVNEGAAYSLTVGAVTDPGQDTVSSYVVHWGDGSSDSYGANGAKSHTYADGPNDYEVTVDLVDEDGTFLDRANDLSVHVNNVAPSTPALVSPADGAITNSNTPAFDWSDSTDPGVDTVSYTIQVDNNNDFSSPEINQSGLAASQFTPGTALADGTYYWRVKSTDSDNDSSAYSVVRSLTIDTGNPSVLSINRADPNPTGASSVSWTVKFSEDVSGVDSSDFALASTGLGGSPTITNVSGSGDTYLVTASTGSGSGTLGLNLVDDGSIGDGAGNKLGGTGAGNGSFTGQVYTIDRNAPSVAINQAATQLDPTSTAPIHFTAVFNEPVSGFGNNSPSTSGSTAGGSLVTNVSQLAPFDGTTWDVRVNGMTTAGDVIVTIPANKAEDAAGNENTASTSVDNTVSWQPALGNNTPTVYIDAPPFGSVYAKGTASVVLKAHFSDPDNGPWTYTINWDDSTTSTTGSLTADGQNFQASHSFPNTGVYTINVCVKDSVGASGCAQAWIVVYDPSGGFVTGGGFITVSPGSYTADPALSGRANFGFNSQYKKNANVPTGETEFNFQVGNLNFHSTAYTWLVVSGYKAQYKGTGTLNGVSGYDFTLTAYDGQITGGGGADRFRIRITRSNNGNVIFDNRNGVSTDMDTADPQQISGGSIVIHKA